MKRAARILVVVAIAAVLVSLVIGSIFHSGMSARATPTYLETVLARDARHMAFPANARALKNPETATEENLREGRMHFADHCAICHGNDGSGDTMFGRGLYPKPPDLRQQDTQKLTDGELFWVIENGVRFTGMPAFSNHDAEHDSWKLVLFIRHLPQLTVEERLEMERNNPKSPDDRMEEKQEDDFLNGTAAAPKPEEHHHQ